jgi:hypothetical protein
MIKKMSRKRRDIIDGNSRNQFRDDRKKGAVMKKVIAVTICLLIAFSMTALSRRSPNGTGSAGKQIRVETSSPYDMDRPLDEMQLFASAQPETFVIGEWTFDSGSSCDAQGWTGVDWSIPELTGCFWHIADATELDGGDFGGLNVLAGDQSLWCGAAPDPNHELLCGYAALPGYGNSWDQGWCFKCIEVPETEEVYIDYLIAWDSEPGYDYTYVEYAAKATCDSLTHPDIIPAGDWTNLRTFNGVGSEIVSDTIPAGQEGAVKIRFRFQSDGAWSDEDGLWNTDGAAILDSVSVTLESSGIVDFEDFEYDAGEGGENPGDTQTADGDWECCNLTPYGDFSGLYPGTTLLQDDPCLVKYSCMWAFINGSDADYACGGHPEQTAVPFVNERGQYIDNAVTSPRMDWVGSGTHANLEFEVYRELPLNNLMFYEWHIRSIDAAGCLGNWKNRNFVYYYMGKDWIRTINPVGDLVEVTAVEVQVALAVVDMCPYWCIVYGTGACHSHAPLYDNVKLYRVGTIGPQWSVRDIDQFQDTFPANGTSVGTGRIDMALDRLPSANPGILPGDSAKVLVSDPEAGLGADTYMGFGASVYFYMRRDPASKPIATSKVEEDAFRWPLVDSVLCDGHLWYQFRMDTCFTDLSGSRAGPVPNAFCIDLNDNYFTNGDTLWFFYGANNSVNQWTWWSQGSGRVHTIGEACSAPMEMQILPGEGVANYGDILYVDNFSGRGAQPYFDTSFEIFGIFDEVDRFDKRGPSSLVGNALAYHATLAQLHENYRLIIWNSGDLSVGTVGDGTSEKADDYALLFAFLDLHPDPNGTGVYFSGDDLAQELNGMTSASSQQFKNVYMPHALITGDHRSSGLGVSPLGIGEGAGTGVPPSVGVFDHGPPLGVDTIIVYGGCPISNDFDVVAPVGTATLEMCYDPANENDDSNPTVVAFDTLNSNGFRVATVLSGFSYHYIRDDGPAVVPDRTDHLADILSYLGSFPWTPTVVKPVSRYSNGLSHNYPNPFNPVTTIRYSICERGHVSLRVYNVAGQLVRTLVNEIKEPRHEGYTVSWDGRNNSGEFVSSGVYFYKLTAKDFMKTRKMVLLK